jgi:intraflagellar transport protein 81
MAEVSEIQFIVEAVNSVLGTRYSLVEFDDLQGSALVQIFVNIAAALQPNLAMNVAQDPEPVCAAAIDFLCQVLNYKIPALQQNDFYYSFIRGEKTVLYPVLYWVLKRMSDLRKRVGLAQYLLPIDVPEDMRVSDDGVREVYMHYTALRDEFKEAHKNLEKLKEVNGDAGELKKKVNGLEAERDKLSKHMSTAQSKLSNIPKHEALLNACRSLRVEYEESQMYIQKYEEQRQLLQITLKRKSELLGRVEEVKRDFEQTDPDIILRRLQDDLACNQILIQQKLPLEIAEKNEQLMAVYKVANESADLPALRSEDARLDKELGDLQRRAQERLRGGNADSITAFKHQVQVVQTKKNTAMKELTELKKESQTLMETIQQKEQQIRDLAKNKALKGDDVKKFANALRTKQQTFKNMKTQLAEYRSEYLVLQHTEEILRSRHEALDSTVEKLEREKGIVGYRKTDDQLVKMAEKKNQIDIKKGNTLEEVSRTVQQFVNDIRDRRNKLAPQVIEMRTLRTKAQEVEQDYNQKKEAYEYQEALLLQETNKLQADVNQYEEELHINESLFHRLQMQMNLISVQKRRAEEEKEFKAGSKSLPGSAGSYTQLFVSTVDNLERKTRELREKKKFIEEHHVTNINQMEWFTSLKKLLDCKLTHIRRSKDQPVMTLDQEIGMSMGRGGVDMLVLPNN